MTQQYNEMQQNRINAVTSTGSDRLQGLVQAKVQKVSSQQSSARSKFMRAIRRLAMLSRFAS